jgi:hypothetical protein
MNSGQTWLEHNQMQGMLPDYVFGRLSEEEQKLFETNLGNFPDLQDEIKNLRGVFQRLDTMDLDAEIEWRTRNMSVKVHDRLTYNRRNPGLYGKLMRYLAPALGVAFIALYLYNPNFLDKNKLIQQQQQQQKQIAVASPLPDQIINDKDLASLDASMLSMKDMNDLTDLSSSQQTNIAGIAVDGESQSIQDEADDYIAKQLLGNSKQSSKLVLSQDDNYDDLIEQIEQLDDNDIQYILKELKNAKISS